MKIAVFSTKRYDRTYLERANERFGHELRFFEARLSPETAALAEGFEAVCPFVNDDVGAETLERLAAGGTRIISLRSAGFNHVDLARAGELGLTVVRVPAYSPNAVAEHTLALMLALNRQIPRAYSRIRDGNFSLDGLLGFDMQGKTVGIIGTGRIGTLVARLLMAFECRTIAYDAHRNPRCAELGIEYVGLDDLLASSDIMTLHCPLTPETHHLIDARAVSRMKRGVMIINTSRGAVLDTRAVVDGLKTGAIGYLGMDVYEEEESLFFEDLSGQVIQDDVFARLLTFPNVLITGHQGFFTREALENIALTTLENVAEEEAGRASPNRVTGEHAVRS